MKRSDPNDFDMTDTVLARARRIAKQIDSITVRPDADGTLSVDEVTARRIINILGSDHAAFILLDEKPRVVWPEYEGIGWHWKLRQVRNRFAKQLFKGLRKQA